MRPCNPSYLGFALIVILSTSILSLAILAPHASYAMHKGISVTTTDIVYDPGDDVFISGGVADLDPTEPQVKINIYPPGGSGTLHSVDFEGSGSEFSYNYPLSTGADEGMWKVRVTYNGHTAYTFFKVRDDIEDEVSVDTDKDAYDAGQTVQISGQVLNVDNSIGTADIAIRGPSDSVVKSLTVNLDNDLFSYNYKLSSTAEHGRYVVEVTYNNNVGISIFDVNEDTSGSDVITAQTVRATYAPGDTVKVTGDVDPVDGDTIDFEARNPSNTKVADDVADVDAGGSFAFQFNLAEDASTGKYKITLTYGTDVKAITFDVAESSGGASGLTAELNKLTYLAGETMTVSGKVSKRIQDQTVNVLVYNPDKTFSGLVSYLEPKSDLTYETQIKLRSTMSEEKGYEVKVAYGDEEIVLNFNITGIASPDVSGALTVNTDKVSYHSGDTIKVSGKISQDNLKEGIDALISVYNPDDNPYRYDVIKPSTDGSYSYLMVVGGALGVDGTYQVTVTYDKEEAKTTFELKSYETPTYVLNVGKDKYLIQYGITDGTIKSMFVKPSEKKLVISIDAQHDGKLTLVLPRNVIDSYDQNGTDIKYVVISTDIEQGVDNPNVDVQESESNNETRTIVIDYKQGTDLIEIAGTSVVPEFGPI
jgi:uncharacterized protein YfaS (alpha-2-macroglobulin family)